MCRDHMRGDPEVHVCPDCGARSDELRSAMFSGTESAVRDHGTWLECKKCGKNWDKKLCGPKCPSHMDVSCSRNPDQSEPCELSFKDLSDWDKKKEGKFSLLVPR